MLIFFFFSWNSLAFLYDSIDVGNFISGFSDFYKPRLYIWKFLVHILLRYSLKDFEHYFASIRNDCNFMEFELCTIWRYLCQIDCYFLFICLVLCFFFFLPCVFICCMFLGLFVLFNLLYLESPFSSLEGHHSTYLWSLLPVDGVRPVSFEGFLVGGMVSLFSCVELLLISLKGSAGILCCFWVCLWTWCGFGQPVC